MLDTSLGSDILMCQEGRAKCLLRGKIEKTDRLVK